MDSIIRCPSCDGFGWLSADLDFDGDPHTAGAVRDCDWCSGVGYVYREPDATLRRIPPADYAAVAQTLETLERERMRELGYSGDAVHPSKQAVRRARRQG